MKRSLLSFFLILFVLPLFAQNNPPTAVNDTAWAFRGHVLVDVLDNDFDIDGNKIEIFSIPLHPRHGDIIYADDSIIEYHVFPTFPGGFDSLKYCIRDHGNPWMRDTALLYLRVDNSYLFDSVDVNNIVAGMHANGLLFNKDSMIGWTNYFEVPRGQNKNTFFYSLLWFGGFDSFDTLHFSGSSYRRLNSDYYPGPNSIMYDSVYDYKFKRLWSIEKSDIDYHINHFGNSGYIPSSVLMDWPGNGDTTFGQSPILAPFKDLNNDGVYNPWDGDYPLIKGDKTVYFMFNDDRIQDTLRGNGRNFGVEIHGLAYAFDCPSDSALNNAIFINFKIYNRSDTSYHDCYIGLMADFDLGDPMDDFIGTDVGRNSYYVYNGKNIDGTGKPQEYGAYPPAQAVTLLKGILSGIDGEDNVEDCIIGFGSDDGIIDNECLKLSKTIYNYEDWGDCNIFNYHDPPLRYFDELMGKNYCGENMPYFFDTANVDCNFVFPGLSDPYWCCTNGIPQAQIWSEETAGNYPNDRRCIGSIGPFNFLPGEMKEIEYAFVFGRDYTDTNATAAITVMQQRIDSIIKYFRNDTTPCGLGFSGITPTIVTSPKVNIYPNPAIGYITVDATGMLCDMNYEIYDILGRNINHGLIKCTSSSQVSVSGLDSGIYIISVSDGKNKFSRKFIKQ